MAYIVDETGERLYDLPGEAAFSFLEGDFLNHPDHYLFWDKDDWSRWFFDGAKNQMWPILIEGKPLIDHGGHTPVFVKGNFQAGFYVTINGTNQSQIHDGDFGHYIVANVDRIFGTKKRHAQNSFLTRSPMKSNQI